MPTRVKYDGLKPAQTTWVFTEDRSKVDTDGCYELTGQPTVGHNDIVEVEDFNDPKSHRARIVRGHVDGLGAPGQEGHQAPIARVIEEKEKRAPKPAPSQS